MISTLRTIALSKRSLLTYLVETFLLLASFYGFWQWAHAPTDGGDALYLVSLGVVPLLLFFFVAMRAAAGAGRLSSLMGFQFRIDQLQKRLNAQDDFFRSITDTTPSALTIYNNENEYWFVNASAARNLRITGNSIIGKKPVSVLGAEQGRKIEKSLDQVRATNKPLDVLTEDFDENNHIRYVQTSYQALSAFGEFPGGVMAREENVTTIILERERRENMLRQVLSTLVAVVDRRDPYASGHSGRVGLLSRALAEEMHLTERECEAAEIAGSLMNFGKVLVSRSILTKTDALTEAELQRIRDGILTSADILSLIDFGTPVVATLRQVLERPDGTGAPYGLHGDAILITARIVAVANAFVALVSPRAYRPGAEFSIAAERLAKDAGKAFDNRVIAALGSFLKKNDSKLDWLAVTKPSA
jgi:HD-GYP domain-containing protein (c-di-GMP phosphodiesterase class II)